MNSLTRGFHRHHIIPRYMGGGDSPENLVLLHPIDHAIAHYVRFKLYKNVRDQWATNWLLKIKDPDVYTAYSVDREAEIKKKRLIDPEFDKHMRNVRSNATKNRKEGYQKAIAIAVKNRIKVDPEFRDRYIESKKKAQKASSAVTHKKMMSNIEAVKLLRNQGLKYSDIQRQLGFSIGFISKAVNYA